MRSPEDCPADIRGAAQQLALKLEHGCEECDSCLDKIARALMERDRAATERERARWKPAAVYFERYCQDEADEVEDCVCGQQQHDDAKAFAAAIRSQP